MLTPEYLDQLPDSVIALYQQAEMDILKDMARRILSVGEMTSTAEYQMRRLEAMGASREYIMQMLSSLTRKTRQELQHMMIKAGAKTLAEDDEIYRAAGKDPKPVSQSPQMQRIIRAGLKNTMGLFRNLTRTTAKAGQEQLIRAMDRAWMQIVSGGFDYRRAVENAIKSVAASGLSSVQYPSGHSDSLDVAVRRAVLTGVNQTGLKMQDARMDEMDCRFVEVSAHGGARNKALALNQKFFILLDKSLIVCLNFFRVFSGIQQLLLHFFKLYTKCKNFRIVLRYTLNQIDISRITFIKPTIYFDSRLFIKYKTHLLFLR